MIQVNPGQTYALVRKLEDPTDTNTYYVQAVIKSALDNTTLKTVQFTDQGGQLFTYNWEVPQDSSPHGLQIYVISTVYTDSGYTSKSPNHQEKAEEYLVLQKWGFQFGNGGGGASVDYKKIREIMRELLEGLEFPEPEKVNLAPFEARIISALTSEVRAVDVRPVVQVDIAGISKQLAAVLQTIASLPAPEKFDYERVVAAFTEGLQATAEAIATHFEDSIKRLDGSLIESRQDVKEHVAGLIAREMAQSFKDNLKVSVEMKPNATNPASDRRNNLISRYAKTR